MSVSKDKIRAEVLDQRRAVDRDDLAVRSLEICNRVAEESLFLDAGGLHIYSPLETEVNVRPLLEVAWALGIETGMMVVDEEGGSRHVEISEETTFRKGAFNLMQPVEDVPFDMTRCDLVLVPAVAVDPNRNRIGYGKGYYDQFLTKYPRPTICPVFDLQVVDLVEATDRDVLLDIVLTETRRFAQ